MAPITGSVEIARSPQDVFEYVADVTRRSEWQEAVLHVKVETPGVNGVGTRVLETRRLPGGPRDVRWEVTEYQPPSRWAFHGVGNPVDAIGEISFFPLDGGSRTRVEFRIDFEARGFAKLMAAAARRGARDEVPRALAKLKWILEAAPGT
ncbi:MAG: SRPBCC family protein [Candidatus Limnocylindria bacterium]